MHVLSFIVQGTLTLVAPENLHLVPWGPAKPLQPISSNSTGHSPTPQLRMIPTSELSLHWRFHCHTSSKKRYIVRCPRQTLVNGRMGGVWEGSRRPNIKIYHAQVQMFAHSTKSAVIFTRWIHHTPHQRSGDSTPQLLLGYNCYFKANWPYRTYRHVLVHWYDLAPRIKLRRVWLGLVLTKCIRSHGPNVE